MSMICELFIIPSQTVQELQRNPDSVHDVLESLEQSDDVLSLEKSWHGIHFVLTGTAAEGRPPLNVLVDGGVSVGDVDVGYGPARLLDPLKVHELDRALAPMTSEEFRRRFDPAGLAKAGVYPQIWDEPVADLIEEYDGYFQEMKLHIHRAASHGHAMLIVIS